MGLFGGKSNSNTQGTTSGTDITHGTTDFNQTSTPILPDWVSQAQQGLYGGATTLADADPTTYVAGPNSLLSTAAANATNLSGTPWDYDAAEQTTGGVANAKTPSIAGNVSSFMDPYLNSVVNATSADLDHSDGIARANDDLALAASGAFGGSGAALTKAATEDSLSRARATSLGGLRSQGYTQALGAATSQAQLQQQQQQQRLQAAAQMANIADQYGANSRANIATQDAAGAPLQAISQAKATAPLDLQTWLASIFGSSQPQLGVGQNQAGTQTQDGTENQTGSTTGKGSTFSFGFGGK